jgi:mannose-1-phosphate guanylyltransferase/mannose-6-phosphate isomerase
MLYPIIMAGGSGTRLWPLSREAYPKQFLDLTGDNETLFQKTLSRLDGIEHADPIIVCNEQHRFIAGEQLRQLECDHSGIILEPCGRNTAPAICLAALHALDLDADATLLVLSADHVIQQEQTFKEIIQKASETSAKGQLVTFGIVPTEAATGYGYIKTEELILNEFNKIVEFVEKPDAKTAQKYFDQGDYLWNSGMFLFSAQDYIDELNKSRPDIFSACQAAWQGKNLDLEFIRLDEAAFEACPSESVDYAIMEVTDRAYVMPMDAGWSDVGSWDSLAEVIESDKDGNIGIGDVVTLESKNSFVHSEDKLVTVLGVDDIVVINTKDAVLVTSKERSQDVKLLVNHLNKAKRTEHIHHRVVYRPWGHYDSMDEGERFQVKRITVKPGAKLSVQKHHHRAEHWVVVSGSAKVRVGEEEKLLTENESVFIPLGEIHSLENPGKIPLELIEVQSGSYLGEDDIVRFEDLYGRT